MQETGETLVLSFEQSETKTFIRPSPAGALGLGLIAATGIVKTFQFLAYALPILGGVLADTKWGRFKTICIGTAVGAVAHILMTICEPSFSL